uniref:Uncharacterized protein n=1 Tax=Trichobilharzia regenti TaxID=157069 RepID=A0AA85K4J8_TRIRE|nr:unnamed protein product [Trichobilharzia regenti]
MADCILASSFQIMNTHLQHVRQRLQMVELDRSWNLSGYDIDGLFDLDQKMNRSSRVPKIETFNPL